jgi:hypothetical protein
MEKIVYSERIRDLIDHLVRIKVIHKKKGYLVGCKEMLEKALDISTDYDQHNALETIKSEICALQREEIQLRKKSGEVKTELAELLMETYRGKIVRAGDSVFHMIDQVEFASGDETVIVFHTRGLDTKLKVMDAKYRCCADLVRVCPEPLKLELPEGEHYLTGLPRMHFVTWEDLGPEFELIDQTGSIKKNVAEMWGIKL